MAHLLQVTTEDVGSFSRAWQFSAFHGIQYAWCRLPSLPIVLHGFCQLCFVCSFCFVHPLQYGTIRNKGFCHAIWMVNSLIKSSMDTINQLSTQTNTLCAFQRFVSNLCSCMNGKYLLKSFNVWNKKTPIFTFVSSCISCYCSSS